MLRDFGTSELGHTLQDGLGSAADWTGKQLGIDTQSASTGLGGLGGLAGAFLLSKLFNMDMPQAMMLAMVLGGGGSYLGGMLGQKRHDYQEGAKGMDSMMNYDGQNEQFPTPISDPNQIADPMTVQSIPQQQGQDPSNPQFSYGSPTAPVGNSQDITNPQQMQQAMLSTKPPGTTPVPMLKTTSGSNPGTSVTSLPVPPSQTNTPPAPGTFKPMAPTGMGNPQAGGMKPVKPTPLGKPNAQGYIQPNIM